MQQPHLASCFQFFPLSGFTARGCSLSHLDTLLSRWKDDERAETVTSPAVGVWLPCGAHNFYPADTKFDSGWNLTHEGALYEQLRNRFEDLPLRPTSWNSSTSIGQLSTPIPAD